MGRFRNTRFRLSFTDPFLCTFENLKNYNFLDQLVNLIYSSPLWIGRFFAVFQLATLLEMPQHFAPEKKAGKVIGSVERPPFAENERP
jgi:hypothetical protein